MQSIMHFPSHVTAFHSMLSFIHVNAAEISGKFNRFTCGDSSTLSPISVCKTQQIYGHKTKTRSHPKMVGDMSRVTAMSASRPA